MDISLSTGSLDSDSFNMWAKDFLLTPDIFLLKEVLLSENCIDFLIIKSSNPNEVENFEEFLDSKRNQNILISSKVIFEMELDSNWFMTKGFELIAKSEDDSFIMLRKSL